MTLRDDCWDTVLTVLVDQGRFKLSELPFEDSQKHTVRRVVREMESKGWVERKSKHAAIWRIGPKGRLLLDVDQEVIEKSKF
jgi:ribosomal protein S19E (S16A)